MAAKDRLPDIVQTDFGGGEINFALKRRDNLDFVKTGGRQMRNWRIEAGGTLLQRPGKRPVFPTPGSRNEYVRMQTGHEFIMNFGWAANAGGTLTIYSLDGTSYVQNVGYDWNPNSFNQLSFCVALFDIIICGPSVNAPGTNFQPQIARWDPYYLTWTFLPYSFRLINFQVQEPFYRFGVPGATMSYDGYTGNVQLTCSATYFTPGMVGMRLSIVGQQVTITQVIDPQHARVNVAYRLPDNILVVPTDLRPFQPGMIAEFRDRDLKMEIGAVGAQIAGGADTADPFLLTVTGVMLNNLVLDSSQYGVMTVDPTDWTVTETLISPIGSSPVVGIVVTINPGMPTVEWTEEFMCNYRGWPARCAYTMGRLAFYGFPAMQEAILWSAVGADDVCWVDPVAAANQPEAGANPDSAILEFESSRPAIVSVVEWGDVFVFTDRGIFEIPVGSSGTPLSPGNVVFRRFSNDGVSSIPPVSTQDCIVYINAGLNRCSVVRATGALTRPYISDDVSESHAPLFTGPIALSIATGDGQYPERYVYVVNDDGTIVVGKFTQNRTLIGWVPWTSVGRCTWVTNAGPKVWFTTAYNSSLGLNFILEAEEPLYYLDGMAFINDMASGMVAGALGPLWHLAGMTVQVCDQQGIPPRPDNIPQGPVDWGDRQVDGNGYLIIRPEDTVWSGSPTVYAGLWSAPVFEPFLFPPKEGTANPGARGKRRGVNRIVLSVEHSNGFSFGRKTIPPINWLEDPTKPQVDPPFPLPEPYFDRQRDWPGSVGPDPDWPPGE